MRLKPGTLAMTAVLGLLTALGPLATDMYLPSLPAIAGDLGTTTAGAQLTLSAFLLGFAVGQFVYGPVSDRLGRRPVLLFGLGLFVLASVACTLAPTIEALVGARFVQALGASGPIVLARAMVRDLYEGAHAGRELSRMGAIMGLVPAVAPVLGGVLHTAAGWRANFVATVVFGCALAAIAAAMIPETIRARTPGPLSFGAILRGFRFLLGHGTYRTYVGLAALTYGGLFAFISGSSFVLQGVYGLSELAYGFSFGFVVLGYLAGTLIAQAIVGRRGLDGTIALGVACLAVGGLGMLAMMLLVASPLAVIGPMAVYTLGVGLALPPTQANAMMPFPERAGAASSLLGICQMTFAALLGIGLGQALGASALPLPLVVAATGGAALALFVASRRARAA